MARGCIPVLAFQSAIGRDCLALLVTAIGCYGAVLDPRPDLAMPARHVRLTYAWWW